MKQSFLAKSSILVLTGLMLLPLLALAINAVSTQWSQTILPTGFTSSWLTEVVYEPRFQAALLRSVVVAGLAIALSIVLIIPAVLVGHVYWPALDRWLARLVILPYAVPAVVLVVGYLKIFSVPPLQINGTLWILVFAYVPICFPMLYVSTKNALNGITVKDYLDAGRLTGASDEAIFAKVIIPLILPALLLAVLLNFSILMGEFVYANLLVGGQFETLQIYIYAHRADSGRLSSAMTLLYFCFLLFMTAVTLFIKQRLSRSA